MRGHRVCQTSDGQNERRFALIWLAFDRHGGSGFGSIRDVGVRAGSLPDGCSRCLAPEIIVISGPPQPEEPPVGRGGLIPWFGSVYRAGRAPGRLSLESHDDAILAHVTGIGRVTELEHSPLVVSATWAVGTTARTSRSGPGWRAIVKL